jgi:hypothetical protein
MLLTFLAVQAACQHGLRRSSDASLYLPRFDRVVLLEETAENSANVSIGDLNGDGHLDIVLAKGRHWPLVNRVLFGDGRGAFPLVNDLAPTADRTYSAALIDIDGDGHLDIVVGNDARDPKLVYLNDGKGNLRLGSSFGLPAWPTRHAAAADLNGDYLPDIIVANRGGSSSANYVCLNRGGGRFDADCVAFSDYPTTTIAPADFNRDGFIDLAVPHRDRGQSYVYLNDGKARFTTRIPFGPPDASFRVAAGADLNGDGALDIVAVDDRKPGTFLYFGQREGTFRAGPALGDDKLEPHALAVGDLNRDGNFDVVVGYIGAPSVVYFNGGAGRPWTPVQFGDGKGDAYGFAIADLDRDGLLDIALARSGAPNVLYFGSAAAAKGDRSR